MLKELSDDFTLDRIYNKKYHTYNNFVISCNECNCARGKQNYNCYYEEKCLERFHKYIRPQVFNIDNDNKKIFYKIKHNVSWGPSIVFTRFHSAYLTNIQRTKFNKSKNNFELLPKGRLVQKVIWFDANAFL